LYSSSDDWKKERGWIIRFLTDGMMSNEDWRVFKRRHTWDLLSSIFQSSETDHALRNMILEVLANLTCNTQATTSLILKSSLLTWIEMQLRSATSNEAIAWVKVLENIIIVVDPMKLEGFTRGGWRSALWRCLFLLVPDGESAIAIAIFTLIIPVALRLSLCPGTPSTDLPPLVNKLWIFLKQFEKQIELPVSYQMDTYRSPVSILHGALGLHEAPSCDDRIKVWGHAVEAMWRIMMTIETKTSTWDALTCRLLLWRAIVGEDASGIGEWARTEVVRVH